MADKAMLKQTGHARTFFGYSPTAVGPKTKPLFYGTDVPINSVTDGTTRSQATERSYRHNPFVADAYDQVATLVQAPEPATVSLTMHEVIGAVSKLFETRCPFTLYIPDGSECKALGDFTSGWSTMRIVSDAIINGGVSTGTMMNAEGTELRTLSATAQAAHIYDVGRISIEQKITSETGTEIVDIAYGTAKNCNCARNTDGNQWIYAAQISNAAPATNARIHYSVDGGQTWDQTDIDNIGSAEPVALDIANNKLIVLGNDANGAYYWADLGVTGIPGTFTQVTSGFVASNALSDLYVAGPQSVFFSAAGGHIYHTDNIEAGVRVIDNAETTTEDLNRIHGHANCVVVAGDNDTLLRSIDGGVTFAPTENAPDSNGDGYSALWVIDANTIWVGTDGGNIFYTDTGGVGGAASALADARAWKHVEFAGDGAGSVLDIVFATAEVGYFSHSTATPVARIFRTECGGYYWSQIANGMPAIDNANRIAVPQTPAQPQINAASIAVAGLADDATAGAILIGDTYAK